MKSGIYAIINCATGKFYIGSAVNLGKRLAQHKSNLKTNRHGNKYLQSAWNKQWGQYFEFLIIEYCDKNETLKREQWWLDLTQSYDRKIGYNLRPRAESNLGRRTPDDVKKKLSLNSKKWNKDLWPHDLGSKCPCEECKNTRTQETYKNRNRPMLECLEQSLAASEIFDCYGDMTVIKMPMAHWDKLKEAAKL